MGRLHLPLVLILCVLVPAYDCRRMHCDGSGRCQVSFDPPKRGLRTNCEDKFPAVCSKLQTKHSTFTTSRFCQHTVATMICKKTCGRCSEVADSFDAQSTCNLPMDPGPCYTMTGERFYYNNREKSCVSFGYRCEGNENNFKTIKECQQKCGDVQSTCNLPMDPGHCYSMTGERFYYNTREKSCVSFGYRCEGNENNFKTIEECQQKCGGTNPPSTVSTPLGCEDDNGVYHAEGTGFMDDCNRCYCGKAGQAMCTLRACITIKIKTTTKKPEMTASCPGGMTSFREFTPKKSWPKLVGVPFRQAKARILHDCPKLFVQRSSRGGVSEHS